MAGSSSTSANVVEQIYVSSSSSDCNSDTEILSSVSGSVSSLSSSLSTLPTTSTSTCASHSDTSTSAVSSQPRRSLESVLQRAACSDLCRKRMVRKIHQREQNERFPLAVMTLSRLNQAKDAQSL